MSTTRTILIFPQIENAEIIDELRDRYDPLAPLIRPHITLAFPFETDWSADRVQGILTDVARDVAPFELRLSGLSRQSDAFGHWLFLNLSDETGALSLLHRRLYADGLRAFRPAAAFVPHMTLGRFETAEAMERAWAAERSRELNFETRIDSIAVERIGARGESIVETTYMLKEEFP